jgi:hypothetical protein
LRAGFIATAPGTSAPLDGTIARLAFVIPISRVS